MSENFQNLNVNTATVNSGTDEKFEISSQSKNTDITEKVDDVVNYNIADNSDNAFTKFLQDFADKKSQLEKENSQKREYLSENLLKYDSDDYFGNNDFKELYSAAFNALGVNLDTEKFVNLLDKYVASRINSYSKKQSAINENKSLTDSFDFNAGHSVKAESIPKMQDIPPHELEKYIAKYI